MKRLIELRKERGLSQKILATTIGASRARYNNWENDIATPNLIFLQKLSDYFCVSVDYLIGASDYRQPAGKSVFDTLAQDEKELLRLFRETDEDGRSFLLMCAKRVNSQSALTRKKI